MSLVSLGLIEERNFRGVSLSPSSQSGKREKKTKRSTMISHNHNVQGKRITVFINGDQFMPGKSVTLNTHQIPEFDKFCQYLTERVPNRTGGCYRRIYTPNGTEVRQLDQIEAGREYVVSKDRYRKVAKDFG